MTASDVLMDSIPVTMETMQSQRDDTRLNELLLSRLQLTLEVIILLLKQTKDRGDGTSLQQLISNHFTARTTSGSTVVLHIVSLIHFSCDPQLPCVVTRMMKQLCEVSTNASHTAVWGDLQFVYHYTLVS